jgi:phosphate/phosphite/phosphonate ABC transporter binding protein
MLGASALGVPQFDTHGGPIVVNSITCRSIIGVLAAIVLLATVVQPVAQADEPVRIGVLAKRGAEKCLQKWGPTAEYLSEKTGRNVRIQPMKFDAVPGFLKDKKVDFFIVNSSMYCDMRNQFGGEAIASLINAREGQGTKEFGGVLFVRDDSPVQTVADVKGKRFMCVKRSSFGGYQMALRMLKNNGIDPEKDCAMFKEAGTHDKVVEMVLKGVAEVGTVRSDTLERMQAEGKCDLSKLRIINEQSGDFPFVTSTQLYPEWPMAKCAHTDAALSQAVAEALIAMPPDCDAAKTAKCVGWCPPLDYQQVEMCLKELNIGSFGK